MNRKRLPGLSSVSAALACWVLLLASCSTHFKEKYYVGVYERGTNTDDHQAGPTQFYRFRLDGWAAWPSKTRYEAGWYDASVVDRLFGEIRPKASIPTGELPDTSKAPIDIIPLLQATGQVGKDDEADSTVRGTNVKVDLRGKQLKVPLSNLSKIHADRLNIAVKMVNGKPTVVELEVEGAIEATYAREMAPDDLKKEQSVDVTAFSPNSSMECNNVAALDLAGGIIDVTTAKLQSKGETWEGINQFAFTRSPYHDFEWQGGKFQILDGKVRPKFHGLEATGSIARFSSDGQNKINITANSGWLLRLVSPATQSMLTLKEVRVKKNLPGTEHKASVYKQDSKDPNTVTDVQYVELKIVEPEHTETLKAKVDKLKKDGTQEISLSNITFYLDSASMTVTGGDKKPVKIEIGQYRAETLKVESGFFQLSTTRAVERAIKDGKTVVYQDPHRRVFMHFGPEGLGSTQRKDERFVIFMTANPRVLVNRIRALVNSERTQNVVATALITPRLVKEKTKIQEAQLDTAQAKKLADEAKKFVDAEGFDEKSSAELKGKVADWLGQLGSGPLSMLSLLQGATQTSDKGNPNEE